SLRRARRRTSSTSARRTWAWPGSISSERRFSPSTRAAPRSRSTNTAPAAPRERASIPSAPVPANRSRTSTPATSPSSANTASRTLSEVGRVPLPLGAARRLPPSRPAITRIAQTVVVGARAPAPPLLAPAACVSAPPRLRRPLGAQRRDRLATVQALELVAQQRVLGCFELGTGAHDALRVHA